MNITLKKTLDTTPALETYIDSKIGQLSKLLQSFEKNGVVELYLEIMRTTNHHHKGEEVFKAIASVELPGKKLRAEASAADIHKAIDEVRNILHLEIEKYKAKHFESLKKHPDKK